MRGRDEPSNAPAPRVSGRRFVVTGANSGIGFETARHLASQGGHVLLAVRDVARGREAAARMPGDVEVGRVDLADLSSVREFAAQVGEADVLVNNAGVMGTPHEFTVDGFERQIGTNHLGHFALTNLLLPVLRDRVVIVTSVAHRSGEVDLEDLHFRQRRYTPYAAYAQSKLANLLHLAELQRRLSAAGSTLRVMAAHPGYSGTGITGNTGSRTFTRLGRVGARWVAMKPTDGARPVLMAATEDLPGNTFLGPGRLMEMRGAPAAARRARQALDPLLAAALWRRSAELTDTDLE